MPTENFDTQALLYLRKLKESAEELTEALGLSPEEKYNVLGMMYRDAVPPVTEALGEIAPEEQSSTESGTSVQAVWEWIIQSLFPRQRASGMGSTLSGATSNTRSAGRREHVHEHPTQPFRLRVQRRPLPGGLQVNLDLQLSRTDGSPISGATIALQPAQGQPLEQITDAQGNARFARVANIEPDQWQIVIHG